MSKCIEPLLGLADSDTLMLMTLLYGDQLNGGHMGSVRLGHLCDQMSQMSLILNERANGPRAACLALLAVT